MFRVMLISKGWGDTIIPEFIDIPSSKKLGDSTGSMPPENLNGLMPSLVGGGLRNFFVRVC
jgi:hypothetical protein